MEKSYFFNSINGDRKVKAEEFCRVLQLFIGNGIYANPTNNLQVFAKSNMSITVKVGSAWVNGRPYDNTTDVDFLLDISDGVLKRIDRVVLRLDLLERRTYLTVKKGVPASAPVAKALQRDSDAYELGLADILIAQGAIQITQANITDLRLNNTFCGVVKGVIDQVSTTSLFAQYQSSFDTFMALNTSQFLDWFSGMQAILDANVAANLLNLINGLETAKANKSETYTKTEVDNSLATKAVKATTLAGYGITDGASKQKIILATLTVAGWSEVAPFTQAVVAAGHTPASKLAQCGLASNASVAQIEDYGKAMVWPTGEATNSVVFTALKQKPTMNLPVMIVVGDKV